MNKTEPTGEITGKITADPNPLFFGQRCVISWETTDPIGAEIRVSTGTDDEKLVTQGGPSGRVEIPWINDSNVYEFRLYAASSPEVAIDSVKARREMESAAAALREIADEASRRNIDVADLSQFVAAVIPVCLESPQFRDLFQNWERHGFHVTPARFNQPIPDTQSLPETLWSRPSELVGMQMNEAAQLNLLRSFSKFRDEYQRFPTGKTQKHNQFYLGNGLFDGVDALVAYCMIRHFQPRLIIEAGSGFSSLVLGQAAEKNKNSGLICIEPFPREFLREGFPGLQSLIEKKVQDIGLEFFSQLAAGDILFIDSSHTVKIGGDVNYLFLEVLPRLNPGVIVHVHDIFLPFEYRRDWVLDEFRFWTEQYLLQTFLTFNSEFEVLLANYYLSHYHKEHLRAAFPDLPRWIGGSFWMRRKPRTSANDPTKPKTMSLHVFTGLPGSGKSSRLIELVNSARSKGEPVRTFACSEAPALARREGPRVHGLLGCRRRGLTCRLDHFVSTATAVNILSNLSPGTLAAFEEAHFFGSEIVPHWLEASRQGVEILVSTPSVPQLQLFEGHPVIETVFTTQCEKCGQAEASTFLVNTESETTTALCCRCSEELTEVARHDLIERLQRQAPHPGEKAIYQPIDEMPECATWKVVRPDSKARADLMVRLIREAGLPAAVAPTPATYLDIGCNTGYFCDRIQRLGFYTEGVDVVKADIEVAKTLDSYFRKGHTYYIVQDAYAYLHDTQDRLFDVTSAFAVFQWLMIQTTVDRGITCLEWFFAKTKRLCFLEMGYSAEPQYKERLKVNIDREWVRHLMEEKGGFSEIRVFNAKEHGLMFGRDLFVGIKNGTTTVRQVEPDQAPRP